MCACFMCKYLCMYVHVIRKYVACNVYNRMSTKFALKCIVMCSRLSDYLQFTYMYTIYNNICYIQYTFEQER